MKTIHIKLLMFWLAVSAAMVVGNYLPAAAFEDSWWISLRQYHISAHGQIACMSCHEGIPQMDLHPNPLNIGRSPSTFFSVDKCYNCHNDISNNLLEGIHGGREVDNTDAYQTCIRCHNPHYPTYPGNKPVLLNAETPDRVLCTRCHELRLSLPVLSTEESGCMTCHQLPDAGLPETPSRVQAICLNCHGLSHSRAAQLTGSHTQLIDPGEFHESTHADISCVSCHPEAASTYHHNSQTATECTSCHYPHTDKTAHDAHINVSCGACHLSNAQPVRDHRTGTIGFELDRCIKSTSGIHNIEIPIRNDSCRRCHFSGNDVGASTMVLPPKSILCLPCHAATLSVADAPTITGLVLFLIGIGSLCTVWFSGGPLSHVTLRIESGRKQLFHSKVISRVLPVLKVFAINALLQRRLYQRSPRRWLIHSLIFIPFAIRFLWGTTALCLSHWLPKEPLSQIMLNKNHPLTALFFDMSGLMMLCGVIAAMLRIQHYRHNNDLEGMPPTDHVALPLIAIVILVGFITEGMRIAMTGYPPDAEYAFIGYGISNFFQNPNFLSDIYGYFWYAHAGLTALLIAYIPFSKLIHIVVAPLILGFNAVKNDELEEKRNLKLSSEKDTLTHG